MNFFSIAFIMLFSGTYISCRLISKNEVRLWILLIASFIFYGYWDIHFLVLLFFLSIFVFYSGKKIENLNFAGEHKKAKKWLIFSLFLILLNLAFFKYFNFFIRSFCELFSLKQSFILDIALPLGISFFTFQSIAYLVDIFRGEIQAEKDFVTISLLIAFFPKLISGPLVNISNFLSQLKSRQAVSNANLGIGAQIFLFGLVKKVVIADRLGSSVDAVWDAPMAYSGGSILLAIFAYSIQIYCDFSGYTDMAIGVSKVFGYDLPRNFNLPYFSKNVTEFWKRWHITLSQWLMKYLYIPLGGNRKGKLRQSVNLFATMAIGGLWHGAGWNFVLWGIMHSLALVVHKQFIWLKSNFGWSFLQNKFFRKISVGVLVLVTNIFVAFTWVIFRSETVAEAFVLCKRALTLTPGVKYYFIFTFIYGLIVLIAYLIAIFFNQGSGFYLVKDLRNFIPCFVFVFIFLLTLGMFYAGNTAFIYQKF